MRAGHILVFLLVAIIAVAALSGLATADSGYSSVWSGYVGNGDIKSFNGCNVIFTIPANASSVHVEVQSFSYSTQPVTITPGNLYYYYDALLITVVQLDGNASKAYVDIAKPVTAASSEQTGTKIYCDTPGQLALAGDTLIFPIVIQNHDDDRTYTLSAANDAGWTTMFQYEGRDIYQIYVPESQSRTVNLVVHTSYTSTVGEKRITAKAGDNSVSLAVSITSVNISAGMSTKVSSVIASIGEKIYYDVSINNLQAQDNNYKVSVAGLPDGWYYRYVETRGGTSEMAEVVVPASSTKNIVLEIVPPLSAQQGDYAFTASVTTPDGVAINKDLTLKLKGSVSMSVSSDKLAYSSKPGQAFSIRVYVTNDGQGDALTNVYPDVSAPTGWTVNTSPASVNSIKTGETQVFTISVQPPANIVASDYDVKVTVKSDQAESTSDYRITITTDSYVPYIAVALVLAVVAGLGIIYRKYGRR
jgi:uncharacterized membrane protein